ncbi:MAG: hypothetical protein AAF558_08970 [Verrucomicrobiota bacterium]
MPRLLILSSDLPEATRGGALMLHRLLEPAPNHWDLGLAYPNKIPEGWNKASFHLPEPYWFRRLRRTRYGHYFDSLDLNTGCSASWKKAQQITQTFRPDAILTVVYGSLWKVAQRLHEKTRIPLVSIYMDCWPDLAEILNPHWTPNKNLETSYAQLAAQSQITFGICPEMLDSLPTQSNGVVLRPPGTNRHPEDYSFEPKKKILQIAYTGLSDSIYADPCRKLIHTAGNSKNVHLHFFTSNLPEGTTLSSNVSSYPLMPAPELEQYLKDMDALIVTLPFSQKLRRLVQTSFSSKYADYLTRGKPIFIWGPSDAAIVRHAERHACATACCDPEVKIFLDTIQNQLSNSDALKTQLTKAKEQAALFTKNAVQSSFWNTLDKNFLDTTN